MLAAFWSGSLYESRGRAMGWPIWTAVNPQRIARRRGLQLILACLGNVIPVVIACLASWSSHRTVFFIGAAGTCLVPLLVTGLPVSWTAVRRSAALAGLIALTMMQAYSGGAASGYSVLMMMAMVWFGVQAGDRDVIVMIAVLAACAYLPMILFGAPAFPTHWANATLLVLVGATVAGALRLMTRETTWLTEQLRKDASTDPLTGLLNRRGWEPTAAAALANARRQRRPVTAAAFDLDDFKRHNDQFGHQVGDTVLRQTAGGLRSALRAGDIVARSGGDEFVALLIDTTAEAATIAIERLIVDHDLSAGVAAWDFQESLEDLLCRADLALYEAKGSQGRRVETAPASLDQDWLSAG